PYPPPFPYTTLFRSASDNVLRAGLTPKKVDADEVLQCVSITAAPPLRVAPERQNPTSVAYYASVDDFELAVTELTDPALPHAPPRPVPGSGPRILLGLGGETVLSTAAGTHRLRAGPAVLVPATERPARAQGDVRFAQASVPRAQRRPLRRSGGGADPPPARARAPPGSPRRSRSPGCRRRPGRRPAARRPPAARRRGRSCRP